MVGTPVTPEIGRMVHSVWFDLVTLELRLHETFGTPAQGQDTHASGTLPVIATREDARAEEWLRAYA